MMDRRYGLCSQTKQPIAEGFCTQCPKTDKSTCYVVFGSVSQEKYMEFAKSTLKLPRLPIVK